MISALTGKIRQVEEARVLVDVGPVVCELLVPAADFADLQRKVGQEITFHTLLYLEGDPNRGNLEPRLLGFLRPEDKKFFELFTTVKGIGARTALRALTVPVGEIAAAIESRDARFLCRLDGVGKRTAELIVAQLAGKVVRFMTAARQAAVSAATQRLPAQEEELIELLIGGGEKRADAEVLAQRVRQLHPGEKDVGKLWGEALRLR